METIRPPLRIGLLLDDHVQPRWVHRIITEIRSSTLAQIVLVVMNGGPAAGEEDRHGIGPVITPWLGFTR